MSTHNIPFSMYKRKSSILSQICSYEIFSKGLKNEFKTAINVSSVLEPLKVYCIMSTILHYFVNNLT